MIEPKAVQDDEEFAIEAEVARAKKLGHELLRSLYHRGATQDQAMLILLSGMVGLFEMSPRLQKPLVREAVLTMLAMMDSDMADA